MLKQKVILSIAFFITIINYTYSQQNSNIIVWQGENISFSVIVPEGWVAIENTNPSKGICIYFYEKDRIYKDPSMFISLHYLKEATDGALNELAESIERRIVENNKGSHYVKIDYSYNIAKFAITYDSNDPGSAFSRTVYIRYKQFGFEIALGTRDERPGNELINILDNLVNSLIINK